MEKRLKNIATNIMLLMSILVLSNIVLSAIQKGNSESEKIILELEEEDSEKELETKVKSKKNTFSSDDNICQYMGFHKTYCIIKHKPSPTLLTSSILKGFDKFIYSPPELV